MASNIMAKHKIAKQDRWQIETYYDEYTAMPLVVFDHYEMYGCAYEGKLLLAVSDYDPTITEAYIWRNGKVETIDQLHRQIEQKAKAW